MLRHGNFSNLTRKAAAVGAVIFVFYLFFSYHSTISDIFGHEDSHKNDHHSATNGVDPSSVKQSWMNYPHRISLAGTPSLLNTSNPKPLNVLLVNIHPGVRNDIQGILSRVYEPLKRPITITDSTGLHEQAEYIIDADIAKDWYERHKEDCDSSIYDLMIVGDVIAFGRPYLHAACKMNIILYITNRFDYFMPWDTDWAYLVANASRWPNVRVMENNLHEWHYGRIRGVDIHLFAYAPSTGLPGRTAHEMLNESEIDWSTVDKNELLVISKFMQTVYFELLDDLHIPNPRVIPERYGGPLALAGRLLIYVPYQVNNMLTFECMNNDVLIILPSLRLFQSWRAEGRCPFGYAYNDWTDEELMTYADWWRKDLADLFFYFDDIRDLAPGSAFRQKIMKEQEAKRRLVKKYMAYHIDRTTEAWWQALESFPRLSEATPITRHYPLATQVPFVAELPPPRASTS